jgi:diguanylate cyclase (GGDEF)-like protein
MAMSSGPGATAVAPGVVPVAACQPGLEEITPGPARRERPWARLGAQRRVLLLVTAIASSAAALFFVVVTHLPTLHAPLTLSWPVWAAAFAVGEILVVHVQVRRDSHSFSLTDVVLVAGLCLMQPAQLVGALVTGTGVALVLHRRQSGVKLAFNVAQNALGGCVATIVFAVLTRGAAWSNPWDWAAALAAVAATTLAADLCIFAVLSLSDGAPGRGAFKQLLALSTPFTLGSGAVGLLLVRTAVLDPTALVLLAPPCALVIIAYRAYAHAHRQQDNLQLLHEVTSLLYDGTDASEGLANFLGAVRIAFRAGIAELVLIGEAPDPATISRSRDGYGPLVLLPVAATDDAGALLQNVPYLATRTVRTGTPQGVHLQEYAAQRGLKDAAMSVLRTEEHTYGILLVGDRHGDVSTFNGSDLALLETFARHVATSLERGRLQSDLRHVTELQEKLRHQAMHDALTGLPNRTLFHDRARTALHLANRTNVWPAVFYLDLDGFKPINDTYGHEAGDVLLQAFAQRLSSCLRAADTAARLGGDEFAVLVNGPIDADGVQRVVDRIRAQLAAPIDLGTGRSATVGASIGVTIADPATADVETLLRHADTAMYTAKRARDGRFVLHHSRPDDDIA